MKRVAFIPVRGGSQSIPLKNIKPLAGKPLLYWSLDAADKSRSIDEIVVATDHPEIAKAAKNFKSEKIKIYQRDAKNAENTSSTESVMLEYLSKAGLQSSDMFVLIQATNPFLTANDLDKGFQHLKDSQSDSLLSAVRTKRFFWSEDGKPFNYDFKNRPRRQDFAGMMMENGAFYISSVGNIVTHKNRLSGKICVHEMDEVSGFEIDEPADWIICEGLKNMWKDL
jgi:N-acylneuraminate cytidylyltransferase